MKGLLVTTLGGLILGMDAPAPGSRSSKTTLPSPKSWWTFWKSTPEALIPGALLKSVDAEAHLGYQVFLFVGACSALHLLEMADIGVSYVSQIKDPT